MKINEPFEVNVWGILVVSAIVAAAAASATWLVAKTVESNELEGYRRAKEWKVAEAIVSIAEVSKAAKINVQERKELLSLRRANQLFDLEGAKLKSQLAALQSERDGLRRSLASIVKPINVLDLPLGEARFIVPNTVAVGVVGIYRTLNICEVRIGDRKEQLQVGQSLSHLLNGKEYRLALLKRGENSCTFSFGETAEA